MVLFTKCRFPQGSKKRPPENFDKVRVSVGSLITPGTHNQIFACLATIIFPGLFLPNTDSRGQLLLKADGRRQPVASHGKLWGLPQAMRRTANGLTTVPMDTQQDPAGPLIKVHNT